MEIKGKAHCFFEQSGTFKNEFIKLGIPAEDYDIQNNFGETDHVIDLFTEIENAWVGGVSIFDDITPDDLIIAFFPCIYFEAMSMMAFLMGCINYRKLTDVEKIRKILEREENRHQMYVRLIKMFGVGYMKNLRIIFENPWNEQHFLKQGNFLFNPQYIDKDRTRRGDFFVKPTAYWFLNCEPQKNFTAQQTPKHKVKSIQKSKSSSQAGICSEDRSMISPDYARNFICDQILGINQPSVDLQLDFNQII